MATTNRYVFKEIDLYQGIQWGTPIGNVEFVMVDSFGKDINQHHGWGIMVYFYIYVEDERINSRPLKPSDAVKFINKLMLSNSGGR